MTTTESLELGREAYAKQAWSDAFAHFRGVLTLTVAR